MRAARLTLLLGACAVTAQAQDESRLALGKSGLTVEVSVTDVNGGSILLAGNDIRVAISYRDAASGQGTPEVRPRAWIRRLSQAGGPSCSQATWMARASGAIAPDDLPLDRSFLLSTGRGLDTEDRLTVIDLRHRLKSADQLSVTPLGGPTADQIVHPERPLLIASRPAHGDLVAVSLPFGGASPFAQGLRRPGRLAPLGPGIAVLEEGGRLVILDGQGTLRDEAQLGPAPHTLSIASRDAVLGLAGDGSALILRHDVAPVSLPRGSLGTTTVAGGGLILSIHGETAELRWLDDPGRAVPILLPFSANGLAVLADGRWALAWNQSRRQAVPLDIAASRALAPIDLPGEVIATTSLTEAFVLAHAAEASVVDIAPLAADPRTRPAVRRIRLPGPAGAVGDGRRLIGGADRAEAALALDGSAGVVTIAAGGGLADQPAAMIRVRGDQPRSLAWFDRRLQEARTGEFSTFVRLRFGGHYEVVSTTGPGGTSACAAFTVVGAPPPAETESSLKLISGPRRPQKPGRLELAIENRPASLASGPVVLRVHDLAFGESARLAGHLSDASLLVAPVTFRRAGIYAVSIEAGGRSIAPAMITVAP